MLTGVTSTGFEYTIPEENIDMELLDALAEVDDGNVLASSKACTLLLGKEQKKALYNHVRNEKGKVPPAALIAELMDIVKNAKDGKN